MKPAIIKNETKADLKIEGFLLPIPETSEKKNWRKKWAGFDPKKH